MVTRRVRSSFRFSEWLEPRRLLSSASLFTQRQFATGQQPLSIASADFNSDGRLDVAVANSATSNFMVYLGNGDGTFAAPDVYPTLALARSLTSADFNGDGKVDLAVTDSGLSAVRIYLGNGDGSFALGSTRTVGNDPYFIKTADFNGDQKLDLAVASFNFDMNSFGSFSVMLGNGDGTFAPATVYSSVGKGVTTLATADFNGDSKLDVLVLCQQSSYAAMRLGNGDGTFNSAGNVVLASGAHPVCLTAGDFNNDSRADIAYSVDIQGGTIVRLGNGDGTFTFGGGTYSSDIVANYINAADYDGDGKLDLASVHGSGKFVLLHGNGDGTFVAGIKSPAGANATFFASGDFDQDGKLDMAVTIAPYSQTYGYFTFLKGNGDGSFGSKNLPAPSYVSFVGAADFNGDGITDLVSSGETQLSVLVGNGNGTSFTRVDRPLAHPPGQSAIGDFNGDGKPDLAVPYDSSTNNTLGILVGVGNGTFLDGPVHDVGFQPYAVITADFNLDGRLDLATIYRNSQVVSVLLGNGDGTFADVGSFAVGDHPLSLVAADFNGDQIPDLATVNSMSDEVSVLLGNGNGTFGAASTLPVGDYPTGIAAADLNGDDAIDLAVSNFGDDDVTLLFGLGNGTFSAAGNLPVGGANPEPIGIGDFNADGRLDLVTANYYTYDFSILLNQGSGTFADPQVYASAGYSGSLVVADLDRDGHSDVATADYANTDISARVNLLATPSYATLAGGTLTIDAGGAGGAVTLSQDGSNIRVLAPAGAMTFDAWSVNSIVLTGTKGNDTLNLATSLAKPLTYDGGAGDDTLNVNAGTFNTSDDLGSTTQNLTLNIASGAAVVFNATQHLAALNLLGDATIAAGGGTRALVARALSVGASSKLDLNDHDLILDYNGASQLAAIQALINSARAGGSWTGFGITSSAARSNPQHNTTLGAMESTDYALVHGGAFDGETADASAVLVKYTYYGDSDFNGRVNFDDYVRTDSGFNNNKTGWTNGDFDGNGVVNFDDYVLVDLAFNTQGGAL